MDGCEGTDSRTPALETSRVPSRGLVSAPNQPQGCSRSGSELCPSELIIMKKHSARVAPLSACNSPVLTLTKVEGREFRWDRLYPRKLGAAGVPLTETGAQLKYFCSRIVFCFCFFKTRINFRKSHCEQHEATGISQALNFKSMMQYLWVLTSRLKIHFLYMSDVRCFTWMLGCFISLVIRQRWQICSVAFKWLRYWRTDFWEWARLAKAVPKMYWSLGRVLSCYCSRDSPRTLPRVPIITGCRSLCLKCQRIMPGQPGHEPSSKCVIGGPIKRSVAVSFSLPHSLMLGLTGSPLSRLKMPLICRSAGISCWHH